MNFDARIRELDALLQRSHDLEYFTSQAEALLDEMDVASEGVEDGMVFHVATRAIEASYRDESFHTTRRLVQKYEGLIIDTCYNGEDPIDVHVKLTQEPSLLNRERTFLLETYRNFQFAKLKAALALGTSSSDRDVVEAGAWHLFLLAFIVRAPWPEAPSYPLNEDTVVRLIRNYETMSPSRKFERWSAMIVRCAELLNRCRYQPQAEAILGYAGIETIEALALEGTLFWPPGTTGITHSPGSTNPYEATSGKSPASQAATSPAMSAKSDTGFTKMTSSTTAAEEHARQQRIAAMEAAPDSTDDGSGCLIFTLLLALIGGLVWYLVF